MPADYYSVDPGSPTTCSNFTIYTLNSTDEFIPLRVDSQPPLQTVTYYDQFGDVIRREARYPYPIYMATPDGPERFSGRVDDWWDIWGRVLYED